MRRLLWLLLLLWVPLGCKTASSVDEDDSIPALWVNPVYSGQMERGTEGEPFKTIEKAIAHANPATRIHLAQGTYRVNLKADALLALEGDDPAKRPVLRAADPRRPVIAVGEKAVAILSNLEIGGGSKGVQVARQGSVQLSGCLIQGNAGAGIDFAASRGMWSAPPPSSQLEACTLSGNAVGIAMTDAVVEIVKCTIQGNRTQGIAAHGDFALNLAAGYLLENGGAGALLDLGSKARVTVYRTDVKANGDDGLHIVRSAPGWFSGSQMMVEECTLSGNRGWGIGAIDRATNRATAMSAKVDPIHLEMNSFAGNIKGMATGIEAR